ncbi:MULTISPECIES: TadE family protein [unclassified Parvimonas]|uniref:TadE/TadG family type IV pilus assembly protein n=1 Tax=unclassified Parvimonas TaxID=1151464 RepID=UPI002B49DECD|nr:MULTISPECIES: TadE family protein [unclassified Parvimonas]MEB3024444.1 TadE family protein [Parvimonas sp. M13]MEB3088726.1 TadE family protein [Parvimonas sp. M20]
MKKFVKAERGQAMVEFAVVTFFIFLPLSLMIMDIGWMAYNYISFDYNYRVTSWEFRVDDPDIDRDRTISGGEANKLLLNEFSKKSIALNLSKISISDATIKLTTQRRDKKYPDGGKSVERRRYMNITGNITYKFEPLTPIGKTFFGKEHNITKKLDKLRIMEVKS